MKRLARLFAAAGLAASPAVAGNIQLLPSLPGEAFSEAVQLDASGDIYVAGYLMPKTPKSSRDASDAFVAKLSSDGSKLLYLTIFGGSGIDIASALAVGADGSVFTGGFTGSSDFPVTAGALQLASGYFGGFIAKLNPAGSLIYAGTLGTMATGIALDSAGGAFISGSCYACGSGVPSTSGTVNGGPGGFVLKLDPTLSQIQLSINGYGGLIALNREGDIYVAGTALGNPYPGGGPPQLSAGAFQSTHEAQWCFYSSGDPSGPLAYSCNYQYVAEIDPTGTNLLWATYVTGTYGATPKGIALDSENNVVVAGTTNSTDYPATAGVVQAEYPPNGSALANVPVGTTTVGGFVYVFNTAPAATGYITKLNAAGSALVWSTYFGGSYADNIGGMVVDANGDIFVSGLSGSSDLPGLSNAPNGCRPSSSEALEFVARIPAGPSQTVAAQPVCGAPISCLGSSCGGAYSGACLFPGVVFSGRFFDNSLPVEQSNPVESGCGGTVLTGLVYGGLPTYSSWPAAVRPDGRAVVAGANGTVAAAGFLEVPPASLRHGPVR